MSRKDRAFSNKLLVIYLVCILLYGVVAFFLGKTVVEQFKDFSSSDAPTFTYTDSTEIEDFDFGDDQVNNTDTEFDFGDTNQDTQPEYDVYQNIGENVNTDEYSNTIDTPVEDYQEFDTTQHVMGYIDPENINQSILDNYNAATWYDMTGTDKLDIETYNSDTIQNNQVYAVINLIAYSEDYTSCEVKSVSEETYGTDAIVIRRYNICFDGVDNYVVDFSPENNLAYGYAAT